MKYFGIIALIIFSINTVVFAAGSGGVGPPPGTTKHVDEIFSEIDTDFLTGTPSAEDWQFTIPQEELGDIVGSAFNPRIPHKTVFTSDGTPFILKPSPSSIGRNSLRVRAGTKMMTLIGDETALPIPSQQ